MSPPTPRGASRTAPGRVVIEDVYPRSGGSLSAVKRVVGEPVVVGATVFADGHDVLDVILRVESPDSAGERTGLTEMTMRSTNPGLDRFEATFTPLTQGLHTLAVCGRVDAFASWVDATLRKAEAGQDVALDVAAGIHMIESAAPLSGPVADVLADAVKSIRAGVLDVLVGPAAPDGASLVDVMRSCSSPGDYEMGEAVEVLVEREKALFSTWYEAFPRSWSTDRDVRPHGTLSDVAERLDYVADMGFDVLYLPPIHPIGTTHRKGPDNAESAGADDPGSPWAIGSPEGGHTAVHPSLGTLDDFDRLVSKARDNGVEIALDMALQCSPDHPWVSGHPEWFRHRPDGSIQYAENPPKRYEDIYPLDFGCDAWRSLWDEVLAVFMFWAQRGVRIFRVDNPHTKPFALWQWLIVEVRSVYPEAIFLAEAFTRPAVMRQLARIGFTQSYTYFTWRVSKGELTDYFTELDSAPLVDEMRPNAWPNTPDILAWHLQGAPREMNALRLVLAATLSASYGIYGPVFELADNEAAGNGKEEYGSSEKYEIRSWDLGDPRSIRELVTRVNSIRYDQLALHTNRTLAFHEVGDDSLICYSKTTHEGPDTDPASPSRNPVLVIVNLDAHNSRSGMVHIDHGALGLDADRPFEVHDLLSDERYVWQGPSAYVELAPQRAPAHIMRVSQHPSARGGR